MRHLFSILALVLVITATPAQAHKVIASVYPSGDMIEGEIGFSNGDMAVDALVEVFDDEGNKIGETQTDEDGFFTFTPTKDVTHVFKSDLGAGHIANARMEKVDVSGILGIHHSESEDAETEAAGVVSAASHPDAATSVASLTPAEIDAIAKAVRDETRPLRREIAAYKEHHDIQSILGGIGYIAGLTGLGFYFAARRRLSQKS